MTIRTASIKGSVLAATIACAASLASGAAAADLEVRIDGLRSADGDVRVALHRQVPGGAFPADDGVVAASFRRADEGAVRFVFADVVPGAYAVAAFHDADGDGALNQNVVGMPTEGPRLFQWRARLHGSTQLRGRRGDRGRERGRGLHHRVDRLSRWGAEMTVAPSRRAVLQAPGLLCRS